MQFDSIVIDGIEYRPFNHKYAVSRCGKVLRKMQPIVPRNLNGYCICGSNFLVHRMVATVWIRPPLNGEEAHHINENRADNRAENLTWLTRTAHRAEHPEAFERFKRTGPGPQAREHLRQLRLGSKLSAETRAKIGASMKRLGIKPPSPKGRKLPESTLVRMRETHFKNTRCTIFGVTYRSFTEAGRQLGIKKMTLRKRCLSENFPDYRLG